MALDPRGEGGWWCAVVVGGGDDVDDFDALAAGSGDGAADLGYLLGAGELRPGGHGHDLDGPPGPAPVTGSAVLCAGTFAQGSFLHAAYRLGWLFLTVRT